MCLLIGSPKISAQMIGIGRWLYLKSCWVHTHVAKNCFVVVWLLGTKCAFTIGTHTHPFNGHFSGTTQVSRYQKGKTNLDFTEARDSQWQWHQLEHMQVCTSLQTDNHASTSPLSFFTGRMPFLPPNQQRQSTEGILYTLDNKATSQLL